MADPHRAGASSEAPQIVVDVRAASWSQAVPDVEALSCAAAELALGSARLPRMAEVSIVLTDDGEVRTLNRIWRGQDKATNVLSFPQGDSSAAPGAPVLLGDVVVAFETARREVEKGAARSLADHLAHLIVHGVLHLLGHDHEDDAEAEAMERLESALLARLGVPDPYHERRSA